MPQIARSLRSTAIKHRSDGKIFWSMSIFQCTFVHVILCDHENAGRLSVVTVFIIATTLCLHCSWYISSFLRLVPMVLIDTKEPIWERKDAKACSKLALAKTINTSIRLLLNAVVNIWLKRVPCTVVVYISSTQAYHMLVVPGDKIDKNIDKQLTGLMVTNT